MTISILTVTHRSVFEYLAEAEHLRENKRVTRNILGCASKFLEYLYSWSKWKTSTHRTEWFYQPLRRITEDLIEYGIDSVRKALVFLVDIGAIGRRINPRSYQDKVYQYRFLLSHKVMDALHAIDKARQGKDLELAEQLVKASLAESLESGSGIRLTAKISEAVDFVIAFSKPETQSPKPEIRSSGSDFQQHRNKQTNIPSESSKPFSTPLPPKAAEPEEEEREEEILEAEAEIVEIEATPTQQPRTALEPEPRQEIQLWMGTQGSEGVLNSDSTKHPALVFSGEDTPWLEQPSRRNARLGRPQWNQAFLEWGGARFAQKFGKADRFEAMGDFRVALENNPDKILARWEEYEGVMGATLQNVADRAAAGVTLDDKDRAKLEKHHRAVANTQVHIPVPQPVLADVAEVAHERRVAEVDWDRVSREADEAIAVEVEPVVESAPLPITEAKPEPEYSTPGQFQQMMGNLMRSFGNRSLGGKSKPVESEPLSRGVPAPSGDTDLVARAIATNDPILLNDPYVKKQLLGQEALGLVSLEKSGDRIVSVEDGF